MDAILTYVVNVVSLGGTYALLALGLAVVFSVLRLINFAHGELMTLAGYALLAGILLGVPFWAAVLAAVLVGGIAAVSLLSTACGSGAAAVTSSVLSAACAPVATGTSSSDSMTAPTGMVAHCG